MEPNDYTQYRETASHRQPGFAYNTYLCTIPLDFDRVLPHWHEQMEIVYIKKGSGTVTVDLNRVPVRAGSIVPILPGEIHAIESDEGKDMEYEHIIFSLSLLDSSDADDWSRQHVFQPLRDGTLHFPRPIPWGTAFYAEASAALDAADLACDEHLPGYSLLVKSSLLRFFHAIYRHRETLPAGVRSHAHQPVTRLMKTALTEVHLHYSEKLTVADVAARTGYSEAYFMRVFRRESGQTFTRYLIDYRLEAACYFLRETQDSVSQIASQCGFDNFSYFIRQFRARYKVTPGAYRKH